jgi:PST family polysaccharide transporter
VQKQDGYRRKVMGGAITTLIAQLFRVGASVSSIIVASRILLPTDYGIYAMAAPVTGFAMLFQNIGFDHAVVQSDEVSEVQLSSLFWLNIGLCLGLALLLVAAGPLVGMFYGSAQAGVLVAASGLLILATAPNPLYCALLNRQMRFHAQSVVDIISSITMLVSTVIATLLIRSYWALLIGAVAATVVNTASFMVIERWRPRFTFQWNSIAAMVGFGSGVSVYGFALFVTRNIDKVLLARVWGPATLGLYDRAFKLMLSPLQNFSTPLSRTLLPVLARTRSEPERYRRAYLMFMQGIVTGAVPAIMAASVGSDAAVRLLLGDAWQATGPIFGWLSATAAMLLINESAPWLFMSTNRSRLMMHWGLFASATVVIGFLIGLPWGAIGMAKAYFFGEALRTPILFWLAARGTPIRMSDIARLHLITVAAAAATAGVQLLLPAGLPAVPHLAVLVIAAYAVALPVQLLSAPGREGMAMLWSWAGKAVTRGSLRRSRA